MGTTFSFKCDKCDHSFYTSGPWEFYRDSDGNVKDFGHPGPTSKEAEDRGLWGFYDSMYCLDCGQVSDIVIKEFKKPFVSKQEYRRSLFCRSLPEILFPFLFKPKWARRKMITKECPICGSKQVFCEPKEIRNKPCLKCGEGKLKGAVYEIT